MPREMIEYGNKIKKEVKSIQSKIKKNIQWTNSERKETGIQINDLEQKEKNKHSTGTERRNKNSKKNKERLRNLQNNFKHTNIWIIGVPEEEKEQEIENLLEKIMKENFPNFM